MAVPVGFEPTVGFRPTQLFESCTFGRSDTVPGESLIHPASYQFRSPDEPVQREKRRKVATRGEGTHASPASQRNIRAATSATTTATAAIINQSRGSGRKVAAPVRSALTACMNHVVGSTWKATCTTSG